MNDYSPFPPQPIDSPHIPQQPYPFNNGTNSNNSHNNSTTSISINDNSDDIKTNYPNPTSNTTPQSQSLINHKLKQLDINPNTSKPDPVISSLSSFINNLDLNSLKIDFNNLQFDINNITPQTLSKFLCKQGFNLPPTMFSSLTQQQLQNIIDASELKKYILTNCNKIENETNTDLSLTQTKSPSTPRNSNPLITNNSESKSQPIIITNTLLNQSNQNNQSSLSVNDINKYEQPSMCTNDTGAPIISLDKAKREFKTVSQAAFRFQFICDAYRRCKLGSVKEKDFSKLEDVLNYVHDQLIKRRQRNSQNNITKSPIPPTNNSTIDDDNKNNNNNNEIIRPILNIISSPICSICNKSFPSNHCYTTCNHPLCIKCLVNTFNHNPKNPKWYMCGVNGCRRMLPPQAHFLVLSYKPSPPINSSQLSETKSKILYKKMLSEYILVRNISYKNMLKIVGEYFSSKLQYYNRWRKCENCDFGFLADPDVSWYQVFELKCVVCNVIQRVQLLGPEPCYKLSIKNNYYPNDSLFKTLIFVRHGEAQNNITPNDPNLRDPNLTQRGKQQCKHLKEYFGRVVNVECILSSVMNRCMQTAILGIYKNEYRGKVPFIVLENLRERLCPMFNRRENISVKKEKYKGFDIDFSECKCDNDLYFDKEKKNEKYEDMNKRAWQFYKYLIGRKEKTIAIVSHEGMLQCLTNIIQSNDKCFRKSFKNAEARLCFLTHRK